MFKVGDRVVRVGGEDYPRFKMMRGRIYTVRRYRYPVIYLKEAEECWAPEFFELAEEFEVNI